MRRLANFGSFGRFSHDIEPIFWQLTVRKKRPKVRLVRRLLLFQEGGIRQKTENGSANNERNVHHHADPTERNASRQIKRKDQK